MLRGKVRLLILGAAVVVAPVATDAATINYTDGEFASLASADAANYDVVSTSGIDDYGDAVDCCGYQCADGWKCNTQVWAGAEAFQNIGDTARTAFNPLPFANKNNFGTVTGFNTGVGLGGSKIRAQVGGSFGVYDWKGRLNVGANSAESAEEHVYLTAGLYKPSDICCGDRISWGIVFDQFFADNWGIAANSVELNQLRWIAGYALNPCTEVGVWGTIDTSDDAVILGQAGISPASQIRAMSQFNAYLRHSWEFGGDTMFYVGGIDQADVGSWQFGAQNTAPLSHTVSVYGNFNYVTPSAGNGTAGAAEEAWSVSAGLVFYFGGKAAASNVSRNSGLPMLPVANNGTFLITD